MPTLGHGDTDGMGIDGALFKTPISDSLGKGKDPNLDSSVGGM
jgi:hypothetical protein